MNMFIGFVLVLVGIAGLAMKIEYAGWVLFVGLAVCFTEA